MDVALTPEQEELVATVTALLSKESTAERVRAAEPLGFDDDLWRKLLPLELVAMALPESAGGYGGMFEDLVLVCEQLGRRLAPVPLIETIVTARVAAAAGEAGQGIVAGALERDARPLATALRPAQEGRAVLVPAGAVAPIVVGLDGDDLVAVESEPPLDAPPNLGCLPLADRDLRAEPRAVLASGADAVALHDRAVQEWKLLTAAALVGLSAEALDMGVRAYGDRGRASPRLRSGVGRRRRSCRSGRAGVDGVRLRGGERATDVDLEPPLPWWLRVHARVRHPAVLPPREGMGARV